MKTTYYRADPATPAAVICTSSAGTDEGAAKLREVLAVAIGFAGRDIWTWKPGALLAMHDEGGTLVCVWRDQRALVKYHRYISQACDILLGEDLDVEHCLDGMDECLSVDYRPRRAIAADQAESER